MVILQNLNPGHGTFGKPYHAYLPDWLAILVIVLLIVTCTILYVSIQRNKKKELLKGDIEKRAMNDLLGIKPKIKKVGKP